LLVAAGFTSLHFSNASWVACRCKKVILDVTPAEGSWKLVDLLGRSMGRISETATKQFVIHPPAMPRRPCRKWTAYLEEWRKKNVH
jgi:hypothetical protein